MFFLKKKILLVVAFAVCFSQGAYAADPIGNHDESTCTTVRGWACDPDSFGLQLQIHFYADGPYGTGRFVGATTASVKREAGVGSLCGNGHTSHGFSWSVPAELKNGVRHPIYAHAINGAGTGGNVLIGNTGRAIQCPGVETALYTLPYMSGSIASRVKVTTEAFPLPAPAGLPDGVTNVVFWRWLSPALIENTNWLNAYTGFTPPAPKRYYQLSPYNTPSVTAIQWNGTTVGMLNVPATTPHRGQIMPITVQQTYNPYSSNIRPWPSRQYELSYRFNLQVPTNEIPGAINYAQAYLAVIDASTGKWFWIGATAFDSRSGHYPNSLFVEKDTAINAYAANPIVSSSFSPNTSYTHMGLYSATTTSTPFWGMRAYQFRMTYGELQQAITDIRATFSSHANISSSPENYKLYGVFFLSEVYHSGSPSGRLGLSVSDIVVSNIRNGAGT